MAPPNVTSIPRDLSRGPVPRRPSRRIIAYRLVLAPALALVAAPGCMEQEPPSVVYADSAGVRIVESRSPAWPEGTGWRVDADPVFRIGNDEEDPSSRFFRIYDVALLAGGDVIVVDGGSSELRRYDGAGLHLWTAGGRGEGPGEFRSARYLGQREDGAFLLWDRALFRLSVIGGNGDLILAERRSSPDGAEFVVQGLFDAGSWLVTLPVSVPAPAPGTAWTDSVRLALYDPVRDQQLRLTTISGASWVWTGQYMLPVPYSTRALRAIDGNRLAVTGGPDAEISVHDASGSLVARYRVARARQRVTESEIGEVIESLAELGQSGAPPDVWQDWKDRMDLPPFAPAFDRLLADGEGNLWARRFEADLLSREPPSWDLFDSAGTWLGPVSTPGGLEVTSIRDGLLAGVYRDELGVEYLSVHRVARAER